MTVILKCKCETNLELKETFRDSFFFRCPKDGKEYILYLKNIEDFIEEDD